MNNRATAGKAFKLKLSGEKFSFASLLFALKGHRFSGVVTAGAFRRVPGVGLTVFTKDFQPGLQTTGEEIQTLKEIQKNS